MLVNQTMAHQLWPGEDVLGKRIKIGSLGSDNPWLTVVGVFSDVRHRGLDRELNASFLRPYSQAGWPSMTIVTRTAAAPAAFIAPVLAAVSLLLIFVALAASYLPARRALRVDPVSALRCQ